jgi:hypothetical protein
MEDVTSSIKPKAVQNHLFREHGADIHYMTAWRAREVFKKEQSTNDEVAFQKIAPYFKQLSDEMPGTHAFVEKRNDNFFRSFVCLAPLSESLQHCIPLLSFDACTVKNKYPGVLMMATMMDGVGQILPLAWATAPIENGENWKWFCENLRICIRSLPRTFTMFSDREKGLETALAEVFPSSNHVFCMKHIEKNVITRYRFRSHLLWEACKTLDKDEFDRKMSQICNLNSEVYDYLLNIDPKYWATSHADFPKMGACHIQYF